MSKRIVFCADGTWNGPGTGDEDQEIPGATNVLKTFVNLAGERALGTFSLSDEEEATHVDGAGQVLQVAKYLHGVGDSDNLLVRLMGGALGAGLVARIVRGYTFISRNYRKGDRIYLVGFSRGAYTARALAGLICSQGLMDASQLDLEPDKDVAYRWGSAVWYASRKGMLAANQTLLGRLEDMVVDFPGFFLRPPPRDKMISANIEAIGVWDTVGSLGIPQYDRESGAPLDALRFADTVLSDKVAHGFHALSADERRADFVPTLWSPRAGIVQRVFPGAHADVGGGYTVGPESGLSDAGLAWMTRQLSNVGVLYATAPRYVPAPNCAGIAHAPWEQIPWRVLRQCARTYGEDIELDESITMRRAAGPVLHCPGATPAPY